jgi:hypothetical protein
MSEPETHPRKAPGRPPKSPEGRREIIHICLSPQASRALTALCDRPIEPISKSAMIERLILDAYHDEQSGEPEIMEY